MKYDIPIKHIAKVKSSQNYARKVDEIGEVNADELKKAKSFVDNIPVYHTVYFHNLKHTPKIIENGIHSFNNVKDIITDSRTYDMDKDLGLDNYVFAGALRPFSYDPTLVINPDVLNSEDVLVTQEDIASYLSFPVGFKSCSSLKELLKKADNSIKEYTDDLLNGPQFKEYFAKLIASIGTEEFKEDYFLTRDSLFGFEVKIPEHVAPNQIIGVIPNYHFTGLNDIPKEKIIIPRIDTLRKGIIGKLRKKVDPIRSREEFVFEKIKKSRGLESKLNQNE